jgi:hypothetical protein
MKAKNVLIALALLAITCSGHAQNLPSYVPANGLVGWWPFNGNANDESGNGNNGTVNGATLTADRFGNAGKAYGFDGINDFIEVNNSPTLSPTLISISLWVNPAGYYLNGVDDANYIVGKGPDFNQGHYSLHYKTISKKARPSLGPGSSGLYVNSNSDITVNNWRHILSTWDGNEMKIYIDGSLENSITNSGFVLGTNSDNLFFGSMAANSTWPYWLNGKIDDIAIYNRALTQQEITALYQGGNTTANCLDLPSNLQQGLVGYWPFCGNAQDESGNGINLTNNNVGFSADRFGNQNAAASFNGTNSYLRTDPIQALKPKSFTICSWINNSNVAHSGNIVSLSPPTWQWGPSYKIWYGDFLGNIVLDGRMWTPATEWQDINANGLGNENNTWYHVTMTYDSLSMVHKFYVSGILAGSRISQLNYEAVPAEGFYIGTSRETLNGDLAEFFEGKIDDIAIWNRALSPQEITQLYNQGICKTSITVTDTLLIHTGITSYNPVAYQNTLKVWPNPGNQDITLDAGNLASMQGWKYKVANTLGQTVVNETAISQQQTLIDLSTWGGNGIYYLHLINPQGHAVEIKKIVLAP